MQFSEAWLRSLVNPKLNTAELCHLVTMAGLEVEAVEAVAPPFSQVVVAEILTAERHPDADRLQVCTVDVGATEPLAIVCGAANARAGLRTACAMIGAELPHDFKIKQAKVRGVASFGMLCSAKELGIAEAADGVMELPADAPVGMDLRAYLDLDDQLITLKLTPNRGDCLSVQGAAREVAAISGTAAQPVDCTQVAATIADTLAVNIEASDACPIYCGRVIKGIDPTARTPEWMARRLQRSGVRTLHPVVDVTNYVLLELGQPMHAFDLAKIAGSIHVRHAIAGEKLALLNDQTIELTLGSVAIADHNGALALAGIMGGATSAVSTASTDIFLEAAHFTPAAMAGRARSYSLSTDSSHRFERGVDPLLPPPAMERATQLILAICGGQAGPVSKVGGAPAQAVAIAFRPERARRLLGMAISDAEMNAIFDHLGLAVVRQGETWQVSAPSYRFDLAVEVDLIEEIARIKGYDNIPATRPKAAAAMHPRPEQQRGADEFKTRLMALGYQEVVTYSFIDPRQQRMAMPDAEPIALVNPIASQMGVMRGSLIPGLLQTLSYNLNRGQERLRIFELGRCFLSTEHGAQPIRLGGLAYGSAHPEQWGEPTRANDFYDLKADLDALLWPTVAHYEPGEHAALHPGQTARLILDGQTIGWLGALHPKWATELNLNRPAILFELDWANLAARPLPRYRGVSRFPAVRRDIAILVDSGHSVGQILDTVYANIPRLVTDFVLFDVYQGQGVPTDKKSLAFKMLLQDTEKTLTDSEIEGAVAAVLNLLAARFGAVLRA